MPDALKLEGLAEFDAVVQNWFKAVEHDAEIAAVQLAKVAFKYIIAEGPQFSGDFVANTKVSMTGAPDISFDPDALLGAILARGVVPFERGDPAAMDYAKTHASWSVPKLGTPIFISSTAKHDEFYASKIENGEISFRPGNVGADGVYRRARESTALEYGTLSKSKLEILKQAGV